VSGYDPNVAPPTEPFQPGVSLPAQQSGGPAYAPVASYGYQPVALRNGPPIGKVRGTGVCILLTIVTLGVYPLIWYYQVHEEMKRHKGTGLGGGLALLLALLVGIVMPYLASNEVGELYSRRGQAKPVSGLTGLWYFPGALLIVGPLVWFVKTNGALNAYWRSLGAR
jgi:hypothetical protein